MSTPIGRGPGAAAWTEQRERSNQWVLRLMRWIAVSAGRTVARGVLHPITLYFLIANGPARSASRTYLGRALGRPATTRDVYRHIHHFAASILDRVYFLQDRLREFDVRTTGIEVMDAPLARGDGAMLVGAHLGSFEALRAIGHERGVKVAMLMYEDNARLITTTLAAIAPHVKLHTIALGRAGAMLALRRWLDSGGIAGLLADRTLPGNADRSRTVLLPFLGQPARFSDGPFRLAAMLRRPVIFMAGLYHGGKAYELRFVELADFREPVAPGELEARILAVTQRYVALLEALCVESPYNWFNFFDFWAVDASANATPSTAPHTPAIIAPITPATPPVETPADTAHAG